MRGSMKLIGLLVVAALAAAALLTPAGEVPPADPPPTPAAAPFAVCPLGEAARRTTDLSAAGGEGGTIGVRVFSAGEVVVESDFDVPAPVSNSLILNDLTGLSRAPVLASLPDPATALESLLAGAGAAASACDAGSASTVILPGGTTAEGETYSVVLANPFSGSATVSIGAASEVGTESDPSLAGVIVPPRSVVVVDLSNVLPGRQFMSASVTPVIGRVVASSFQEGGGDLAAVAGIEPATDWYLPVPAREGMSRSVVVASAGTAEVPFQIDVYSQDGLFEAAYEDTVPARGQVTIGAADLFEGAGAVRVVAAAPVAVGLRLAGDGIRAVIPAMPTPAPTWLLPGAGRLGASTVYLFNPGELEVAADVLSGNGEAVLESVAVPGAAMVQVDISRRHAARVEADGDLVVAWTTATEDGIAGDGGRPVLP